MHSTAPVTSQSFQIDNQKRWMIATELQRRQQGEVPCQTNWTFVDERENATHLRQSRGVVLPASGSQ